MTVKVLHVIGSVDPRSGGPIEGVFASSRVWLEHGHERHVLTLDAPDDPWVAASPIPAIAVGPQGRWYRFLRRWVPWLRYGYAPRLAPWLRRHAAHYDAVIVNGLWNYSSYGTWRGLRGSGVRYFVFPHGMLDPWFAETYPRKHIFKRLYWRLFEHKVLRDAAGVLYTAEEERLRARQTFPALPGREVVIGYGARDIGGDPQAQRAAFLDLLPAARHHRIILFLGRIHPKKGIDLLIEAYARLAPRLSDYDLAIVGPDQTGWRADLEALARRLGVAGRVHFPGMVSGDVKWGAFRTASCFVLPSHQENFGVAVAEAMAAGLPVLITGKVNIWREVEADGAGIGVDDTLDGVTEGLRRMCLQPEAERAAMGRRARASFLTRYDLKKNALDLLALVGLPDGSAPQQR